MRISPYEENQQNWGALLQLCGRYYQEEAGFSLTQSGLLELCQETIEEHKQEICRIFLCFSEDIPIGFAIFQEPGSFIPLKASPFGWGYVRDFYICPEFQKKGFGKALYQALREDLKKQGALGILLTAKESKSGEFWEKMGFRKTARLESAPLGWIYQQSLESDPIDNR